MKKIIVCNLIFLCTVNVCFGFDDIQTHPTLTQKAVESIKTTIDGILVNNLGLNGGTGQSLKNSTIDGARAGKTMSVLEWLKAGSTDEDREPSTCRASNHFHNPLKTWEQAGLSGYQGPMASGVDAWCANTAPLWDDKYSNVVWATNITSLDDSSKTSTTNLQNWGKVREYYLKALTESSKTERESNFAKTFYGLGHVLHLLQDMAVPAHVRNDFRSHLDNFVNIGFSLPTYWTKNPFEKYVEDKGIGNSVMSIDDINNISVTRFWDTDTYTESTGGIVPTDLSVGLSEYTNANFFSEYTIFTENSATSDSHYYPHPAKYETDAKTVEYETKDGNIIKRRYVQKPDTGINVAAYSYFNKTWAKTQPDVFWPDNIPEGWNYVLSNDIYKGYASLLLPRAVGYSAGLINYFFRGKMDMMINPNNPMDYIIINKSGEKMEGTFTLYYDDDKDNRRPVKDESGLNNVQWNLGIEPNSPSVPLLFPVPVDPAPKEKGKYILVFEGKLGNEVQSVVGKIVSAVCTAGEWKLASTRYGGGGGSACYTNLYYGVKNEQCTDEDQKHKYDISYSCVYLNGGLDGGGSCSSCTPVSLPKPTCAPQQFDACDYIPYKSVACSTALTGVMTYEWSCH